MEFQVMLDAKFLKRDRVFIKGHQCASELETFFFI